MDLFILGIVLLVEWFILKPCGVVMYGMLFVMCGSMVFSTIFVNVRTSEVNFYEVLRLLFLFGFGMDMMLAIFYMCDMIVVLGASEYNCMK